MWEAVHDVYYHVIIYCDVIDYQLVHILKGSLTVLHSVLPI